MRLRLGEVQLELGARGLAGWLLYDFRGQNPIAARALSVEGFPLTRRWFYYVSADAMPVAVVHATEAERFAKVPGDLVVYTGWSSLRDALGRALPNRGKVAMEYVPMGSMPDLSRVDAGTVELVRSYGPEVVSSADLVQSFLARWEPEQLAEHRRAAAAIGEIWEELREWLAARLTAYVSGSPGVAPVRETEVQDRILAAIAARGLRCEHRPIVSAGLHSASPHHLASPDDDRTVEPGDVVRIELWARTMEPDAPYAEAAFVAMATADVPDEVARPFAALVEARDAALALVRARHAAHKRILGFEVDRAAREVVARHGYASAFTHRVGHALSPSLSSADAASLDDLEQHDTRELLDGMGWSVHPGLYFERFGLRIAVDFCLTPAGVEVTTPMQDRVEALLANGTHERGRAPDEGTRGTRLNA
jgi:Xaa-Pro aminopeptidase